MTLLNQLVRLTQPIKVVEAAIMCEDCKKAKASETVEGAHLCKACAEKEKALLKELGIHKDGEVKASVEAATGETEFIKHRGGKWVIIDHSGKTLSHHDTREKAVDAMKALQFHKAHGAKQEKTTVKADMMKKFVYGPMEGAEIELFSGESLVLPWFEKEELTTESVAKYLGLPPGEIVGFEKLHGYFARYSAPGFLDATDWVYGETAEAAESALEGTYGLEDDLDEEIEGAFKANGLKAKSSINAEKDKEQIKDDVEEKVHNLVDKVHELMDKCAHELKQGDPDRYKSHTEAKKHIHKSLKALL